MVIEIVCLVGGFVVGFVAAYFVAKNNKNKAVEAINMDVDQLAKVVLSSTEVDEQLIEFVRGIKTKLSKK